MAAQAESRLARIARYAILVLLVAQMLGIGSIGLFVLARGLMVPATAAVLLGGGMIVLSVVAALLAWGALHRCNAQAALLGLGLLVLQTAISLGTALTMQAPGESLLDSDDGLELLLQQLNLWVLALCGLWLAARERRRRLAPTGDHTGAASGSA